ncbi:MAG TPA: fibronectin type III domain-containing protein [Candidatus Polarisedimenticolia bacterium]|nr:fibronectin type III domain-containing protein [Candidatus Polarisedimenticolia bacterium]
MATGRYPGRANWIGSYAGSRLPLASLFILAGVLLYGGCDRTPVASSESATRTPETLQQSNSPANPSPSQVLECPSSGGPDVQMPADKTQHRVILSWIASVSDSNHGDAVGYCIYRSLQGKNQPLLRVNIRPFPKTTCTDDLVENGKKYDYKVRAISATRNVSVLSKGAHAEIPMRKPRIQSNVSPPLCRVPAEEKEEK